jgi:hypothetical protein
MKRLPGDATYYEKTQHFNGNVGDTCLSLLKSSQFLTGGDRMINSVLNLVQDQRKELVAFIEKLNSHDLTTSKDSGWTVSEVIEHLYLTEKNILKGIVYYANQPEGHQVDEKPLHYVLDRTKKVEAPENIRPSGQVFTKEKHLSNLEQSRQSLLKAINKVDESVLKKCSFPHTILGPMSLLQWVEFIGLHERRHIIQMNEILEFKKSQCPGK